MPPLGRTPSRPTFGRGTNRYLAEGCFGPTGEVWCFCNTTPRIEALRRTTRKESSPNLGREFYSCGSWQEPKCTFFLWVDESAQKGRQIVTPPPQTGASTSTSSSTADAIRAPASVPTRNPAQPSPQTSPTKRLRSPTVQPSPQSHKPLPASEQLDGIDFDAFSDDLSEDDIQDPDTEPEDSQIGSHNSSPSKKARFTSFSGHSQGDSGGRAQGPLTPTKRPNSSIAATAAASQSQEYDAIKNDPESPFHTIKRNLFPANVPVSSPQHVPPPSSPMTSTTGPAPAKPDKEAPGNPLENLTTQIDGLHSALTLVRKDKERDARLIDSGRKREKLLEDKMKQLKLENDKLRGDNAMLHKRISDLDIVVAELRTRT
ncbi:uncharacterized protein JCM15063_002909 [Sporobolomyces koalae]|uniref:uncharacterized protein n=1 Tax=Sporobolomyces koalae TaxID=500713 RepID=UPI00317F5FE1